MSCSSRKTGRDEIRPDRFSGFGRLWPLLMVVLLVKILTFAQENLSAAARFETRWFSVFLGQQKIGFIKEYGGALEEGGRRKFRTTSESRVVLNRLGKKVEMVIKNESLENESGLLEKVRTEEILASQKILVEAEVGESLVRLKTTTGGKSFTRELKFSGELLGPVGVTNLTQERLKQPGDRLEFQTLMAELSQVVKGERILLGEEELTIAGQRIKARKLEEKFSGLPQVRKVWIDEQGNEVRSEEPSPFGQMVMVLSNEQEARAGLEETAPGQDQLSASLVKSNVRLPQARNLDRLVVRLKHKNPALGWPQLESDSQKIIKREEDVVLLELKKPGVRSSAKSVLRPEERAEFLKENAFLQPEDPEIVKVAREVAGAEKDEYARALKLRDWVARNLSFDLGFVFAPASEVIRSRKATCAGYAALLASLLRASGLPARYVVGLAYVNGVWGGHAWVEAWINERWFPLDAALCSPGLADAARLAIAWSSLNEGLADILVPGQKIIGSLEIEILEYELAGKKFRVAENQPVYEVRGNRYHNPGLQLTLEAPAGFEFSALDRAWPDKTLLLLKDGNGHQVRVTQEGWFPAPNPDDYLVELLKKEVKEGRLVFEKAWGKRRPMLISPSKSAMALQNGVDIFVLLAEGPNSAAGLRQVLKGFKNDLLIK
ncbi:MAG: transglutaminase-like domain-containing protein [Candidatus Saccharicenans sp.]